jgi:hypothetical protein
MRSRAAVVRQCGAAARVSVENGALDDAPINT